MTESGDHPRASDMAKVIKSQVTVSYIAGFHGGGGGGGGKGPSPPPRNQFSPLPWNISS